MAHGTKINPASPGGTVPLGALCEELGRRATAAAARMARAAGDLAGADGAPGHQDLWRFEDEMTRVRADALAVIDAGRAWRSERDAEVAAGADR